MKTLRCVLFPSCAVLACFAMITPCLAPPPECELDRDNDGWEGGIGCPDCNDYSASIYPGAPESCNGIDNDCDQVIDEGCPAECSGIADDNCPFVTSLLAERVGFGRNTTGGYGAPIYYVESLANSGTGSLPDVIAIDNDQDGTFGGPKWIRFRVNGVITLDHDLHMASNTTVDGRGRQITIRQRTFEFKPNDAGTIPLASNVIIESLSFTDPASSPDEISAVDVRDGSHDVWIDHCQFTDYSDEQVSVGAGATDVTISWSRFSDCKKAILLGWESQHWPPDYGLRVTVHHNYFHDLDYRLPWVKSGKAHVYNNVYERWTHDDDEAVRSTLEGDMYLERNSFNGADGDDLVDKCCDPNQDSLCDDHPEVYKGTITKVENRLVNGAQYSTHARYHCDPGTFNPATCAGIPSEKCYPYVADAADSTLVTNVKNGSGRR